MIACRPSDEDAALGDDDACLAATPNCRGALACALDSLRMGLSALARFLIRQSVSHR